MDLGSGVRMVLRLGFLDMNVVLEKGWGFWKNESYFLVYEGTVVKIMMRPKV